MTVQLWLNRFLANIPRAWFSDEALAAGGVTYAVLYMLATEFYALWQYLNYINPQTRISTATDINLNQIASDLFGTPDMQRWPGELDTAFATRMKTRLVEKQPTLPAIQDEVNTVLSYFQSGFKSAYVFDQQSDPAAYAACRLPLNQGYGCIILNLAPVNRNTGGWFLGQNFLGQDSILATGVLDTTIRTTSGIEQLDNVANVLRACGVKILFFFNNGPEIVAGSEVLFTWDVNSMDGGVWGI